MDVKKRLEFKYVGKVIGQPRPRFTKQGAVYEPKHAREYKAAIAAAYNEQCGGYKFADDAQLFVSISIERELPRTMQRKTKEVVQPDISTPDVDNVAKAVLDALQGIAYDNDAQVVWLFVGKDARRTHDGAGDYMTVRIEELRENVG